MGQALSPLARRRNSHRHNAQGRSSSQGCERSRIRRAAPRIRILEGTKMARFETLKRTIPIPEQVSVQVDGRTVKVKGPLGSLSEDLSHLPVSLTVGQGQVQLETVWPRKREIGMLGTAA